MADKFHLKGPDDEVIAKADDLEEMVKRIEEQAALADPKELAENY